MLKALKAIDKFTRNILIVFAGNFIANFFNLLYQLLIAHRLTAIEFASFNSLLALLMLVTSPLGTLQIVLAKSSAEFNAHGQVLKIRFLISGFLKKALILGLAALIIFCFASGGILNLLKIPTASSGYILACLIALGWLAPIISGPAQGLEFFSWISASSIISGLLKLALAFIFILTGFGISGALGALLAANLIAMLILFYPLRNYFSFNAQKQDINYKKIFVYLFPVAAAYFCWIALISFDMVLVKCFFGPQESGIYALAQMAGKIFLFLPGAISLVMFPKTSGLNAQKLDTSLVLKRSLFYVFILSFAAAMFYNCFPVFVLKALTGKAYPEAIFLGRLFSVSMSFYAALFILISYFLSINSLRFLKYLIFFTASQYAAIIFFHANLVQVQLIICANAILAFMIHLLLAFKLNRGQRPN